MKIDHIDKTPRGLSGITVGVVTVIAAVAFACASLGLAPLLTGSPVPEPPALAHDPSAALIAKAEALIRAGDHAEAHALLTKAVALSPYDAVAYNDLGLALKYLGQPYEAIRAYEQALGMEPAYPEALNNLGLALASAGMKAEAEARYIKAIAADPGLAEAHLNLATLLESGGRMVEAEQHFHAFIAFSTDEAARRLVRAHLQGR
jgi:Flp pilus assembly protein TadD